MTIADQQLHPVWLLGLPVALHQTASAHQEALQRELDVLRSSTPSDGLPRRLFALIDELTESFGSLSHEPERDLAAAIAAGDAHVDLRYEVPLAAASASRRLGDILDEADDFCRRGDLVTLATPPDCVQYRRWFLGEFVAQLDGAAPRPWAEYAADARTLVDGARRARPVPVAAASDAEPVVVRPSGAIDLGRAAEVRAAIDRARSMPGGVVVVDLADVTFMDSVGLSVLVTAHQRFADDGRELTVTVPPALRALFSISGLERAMRLEHL